VEYAVKAPGAAPAPTPSPAKASPAALLAIAAAVAAAALAALALLLAKRRRPPPAEHALAIEESALDDVDRKIIEELKARGGKALQSELAKALGLPKSTAWRHVKKLERLGLVETKKGPGGASLVTLKGEELGRSS